MERGDKEIMSTSVDERVVKLRFDNKQFEQGASESLSTLDKLKAALDFKGMSFENVRRTFGALGKASKTNNLDKLADSVSSIASRFSTTGIIATTALANIANSAVNTGKKIVSSLANQAISGGIKRAFNIEQAKFRIEGLGQSWKKLSDDINYGVLDTAYGFDEAAVAASSLAASGVKAGDEMKRTLLSISGTAAMTGSSYSEIADIFTTVAGRGRLLTEQLNQLSHRGLNGAVVIRDYINQNEELRKHVIELGLQSKGKKKEVEAFANATKLTEANVRDLISASAIEFDTFAKAFETFGSHAKDANQTFKGTVSNMKASLSRMGAYFAQPAIESQKSDKLMSKSGQNLVTVMQNIVRAFKGVENIIKGSGIIDTYKEKLGQFSKLTSLFFGGFAANYSNVYETVKKVEKYVGKDGKTKKRIKETQKLLAENAIQITKYRKNEKTGEKEYQKEIVTSDKIWKKFRKTLKQTLGVNKDEFKKLATAFFDVGYYARTAFSTVKKDLKGIVDFVKNSILGGVWKVFINNFDRVRLLFHWLMSAVLLIHDRIRDIVKKIADVVMDVVSVVYNAINDSFYNIIAFMKGFENGFSLLADIVEFVIDCIRPLGGIFGGIVKVALSLAGGIGRVVSGIYSIVSASGIFKRLSGVISWAIGNAVDLFNWLSDVISNFVDYLTTNAIFKAFVDLFSSIADVIGNFYDLVSEIVISIFDAIFGPIKEHEKDVQVVNSVFDNVVQGIAKAILFVSYLIKKYGNKFVDFIRDLVHNKTFIGVLKTIGAVMIGIVFPAFGIVFGAAKLLFDLIKKYGPVVIDHIKGFIDSFKDIKIFSGFKEAVDKYLKPGFEWIVDFFKSKLKDINLVDFYNKRIKPGIDKIKDFFGKKIKSINFDSIGKNIKKFFKNFDFKSVGKNIISFWKTVKKKAVPALKDFHDWLKKVWQRVKDSKLGKGVKSLGDEFKKLGDKLKKLDLKEALEGFKDFGKNIGKKIIEGVKDIKFSDMFSTAKNTISKFITFLDDSISKIREKIKKIGQATKNKVGSAAGSLASSATKTAGANVSEASNASAGILDVVKNFGKAISDGVSKLASMLPSPKELGLIIGDLISKAIGFVLDLIPPLVETIAFAIRGALENLPNQVSEFSSKITKSLTSAFLEPIETSTGEMSNNVPRMFESVKSAFENIYNNIESFISGLTYEKVQKFVNLINSVLLGMLLKAILKSVKKHNSVLKTFSDVIDKFGGTVIASADKIATAFAGIGTSISTGIDNVFKGLENVEKAYEKEIDSRRIKNYAAAFKDFAKSMLMIVGAIIVLSFIPHENIKMGLERMGMIMFEIAAFVGILRAMAWKDLDGLGKVNGSLLAFAEGLAIFAATMALISFLPFDRLIQGLGAMAGMLGILAVFFAALSSNLVNASMVSKIGVVMLELSGALAVISVSLALLTALDSGKLVSAAIAISLLVVALAGATKLLNTDAVSSMGALAGAVLLLSLALLPFMTMPIENIVQGIVGLGAALLLIGGMSWLAGVTGATAAVAALGAALTAFGIGLGLVSAALWLFVQAMIAAGESNEAVIAGLEAVCGFLPVFVKALGNALAAGAYEVAAGFMKIALAGLQVLADNAMSFVVAGAKLVIGIMDGISMMLPDLAASAVRLVASFFLSLAIAIQGNQTLILASIGSLIGSILNLCISGLEAIGIKLFGWIPGVTEKIKAGGAAAKQAVADIIGDGSTAQAMKDELDKTNQAAEEGTANLKTTLGEGGKGGKEAFEKQVAELPGFQNLENKEMDKLWKQFSKNTANESKKGATSAVNANKTEIAKLPNGIKKAAGAYVNNLDSGLKKGKEKVKKNTEDTLKTIDSSDKMQKGGKKNAESYDKGLQSVDTKKSGKALVEKAEAGTSGANGKFYTLGGYVPEGYAAGVYGKAGLVYTAVRTIVKQAYEEGKAAQESQSPSKLYKKMGRWVPEGYAIGINSGAKEVAKAVSGMVKTGSKTVDRYKPALNSLLNFDSFTDPVIRPVLDLSNVKMGLSSLDSMMNSSYALGLAGSMPASNISGSKNVVFNNRITVDGSKDPAQFADEFMQELEIQARTI